MHLIYLDESGNTGLNLTDPAQPVFALGALIVPEKEWQRLEAALNQAVKVHLPQTHDSGFEIHAGDLRQGSRDFKGVPLQSRLALRDAWLDCAIHFKLRFVCRTIVKKRFLHWLETFFGKGIVMNPHLAAFPLVAQVINSQLKADHSLGILISDENREVAGDIERFQKLLQINPGILRLDRIIEKGFFIDSRKSRPLQLADLCTYQIRKHEERRLGLPPNQVDDGGIERAEKLLCKGNESISDVLQWLGEVQKRSGEEP